MAHIEIVYTNAALVISYLAAQSPLPFWEQHQTILMGPAFSPSLLDPGRLHGAGALPRSRLGSSAHFITRPQPSALSWPKRGYLATLVSELEHFLEQPGNP